MPRTGVGKSRRPKPTLTRRVIAVHEAGHATIAAALGIRVRGAVILAGREAEDGVTFNARGAVRPGKLLSSITVEAGGATDTGEFSDWACPLDGALIALGGPVAETIVLGDVLPGSSSGDYIQFMNIDELTHCSLEYRTVRAQATEILQHYRPALESLAEQLELRGQLDEATIGAILKPYLPPEEELRANFQARCDNFLAERQLD